MKNTFAILCLFLSISIYAQDQVRIDTLMVTKNWAITEEFSLKKETYSKIIRIIYPNGIKETIVSMGTDTSSIEKGFMAFPFWDKRAPNLPLESKNIPEGRNFFYADSIFSFILGYSEPGFPDAMRYNFVKCRKEKGAWVVKNNIKIASEMEDGFRHGFMLVFLNENTIYARGRREKVIPATNTEEAKGVLDPLYFFAVLNHDGSVSRYLKEETPATAPPPK